MTPATAQIFTIFIFFVAVAIIIHIIGFVINIIFMRGYRVFKHD
jgi:hypothetical protein